MVPHQARPLLILDGAFFAHRSYHARSQPPRAAFIDAVLGVVAREQPDFLACAWDVEGPTFRHDLYAGYKANRPEKDPALIEHLDACEAALRALGVSVWKADGFEGDDVVATLARQWISRGGSTTIYTADKDILQLVDDAHTTVVVGGQRYDAQRVEDNYGVPPTLVSAFLALAGDTADGIPGIPGIGKQTAARLLQTFGSLEALIAAAPKIGDRRAQAIVGREDELALFHQLTVLRDDVPLTLGNDDCACMVHPANMIPPPLDEEGPVLRLWRAAQQFRQLLSPYYTRSLAFGERLALLQGEKLTDAERLRIARKAAAMVTIQR